MTTFRVGAPLARARAGAPGGQALLARVRAGAPRHGSRAPWLALLLPLMFVLASCGFPGIASTTGQLPVVNPTVQATPLPPVRFPQDEAPHRDLTEWWYYTGHLDGTVPGGQPHHYGFELVVFQVLRSNLPPVYASHFAISDITRGEFHFAQQRLVELSASIPNGASTGGFALRVGNWTISGLNGQDDLEAGMPQYTLHIHLRALKAPVLHNGNGLITYGLGGFSYYYSRTRMATSGLLIDHNQALKVTGQTWMDHQWGNFLTLSGGGWDWFSIQLANNTELMLYLIRDATGRIVSTYIGSIGPDASDRLLPSQALRVTVLNYWTSPASGIRYPSGWRLDINHPALTASLTLVPQLQDQELLTYQSTGNSYWEGAVSIQGQSHGQAVQGKGYVELTGYHI